MWWRWWRPVVAVYMRIDDDDEECLNVSRFCRIGSFDLSLKNPDFSACFAELLHAHAPQRAWNHCTEACVCIKDGISANQHGFTPAAGRKSKQTTDATSRNVTKEPGVTLSDKTNLWNMAGTDKVDSDSQFREGSKNEWCLLSELWSYLESDAVYGLQVGGQIFTRMLPVLSNMEHVMALGCDELIPSFTECVHVWRTLVLLQNHNTKWNQTLQHRYHTIMIAMWEKAVHVLLWIWNTVRADVGVRVR